MQQLSIFETIEHNQYVQSLFAKRAELTQLADEAKARDDMRAFREFTAQRLLIQERINKAVPRSKGRGL